MAILKTEELTYVYSQGTPFEKTAVDHVNLEIEKGEFVGVIGHTGSGKSTMIQHFNGLLKPTSGKIYLDGEDIWQIKQKYVRCVLKWDLFSSILNIKYLKIRYIRILHSVLKT